MTDVTGLAAVVLAGGRAQRFGSDKTVEDVDGVPLLARARAAVPDGVPVAVAGPERDGGPAAAVLATLRAEPRVGAADWVLVLAADQPFAAGAVARLLARLAAPTPAGSTTDGTTTDGTTTDGTTTGGTTTGELHDGVIARDPTGHRQPLLAVYATGPLRSALEALPDDARGAGLLRSLGGLRLLDVPVDSTEACDVDTPEDLRRAQRTARGLVDGER